MARRAKPSPYTRPLDGGWGWMVVSHFFLMVFLYSSGRPGTHSVDQAGLELRNPPASASQSAGIQACATTPGSKTTLERTFN
ncbi:NAD-dependent protein deacylase sirtuin-5, mitochondrial [Apodemus speciosus]|uniref:NAD-dependent protein deacylase sirtuin-5, mitochondrial n=1 Tax=Apodemus speciosus TaxID=105296 RepID=A0ABQ0ELJ6_APOSI